MEVHHEEFALLGIGDARRLRGLQTTKAFDNNKSRCFVIGFAAITEEAQNALLKTLEEPTLGTKFIFVTTPSAALLPTFLSRVQVLQPPPLRQGSAGLSEKFYQSNPAERLTLVNDLIKPDDENHKIVALKFVDDLEKYLAGVTPMSRLNLDIGEDWIFAFRELRQARFYLQDKSGLPRQVLEHLALVIPTR